jgi:Tfp pilus assembly protein PilX
MNTSNHFGRRPARRGFALLTVLMVLLALLVLCAPFLMTARNTSKAGTQLADRAQARLALDSALRHARARLGDSHISLDRSPYFDDEAELLEPDLLDPEFVNARNDRGVMFSAQIEDVAASIDLNSASPQMFANLLGLTTRTVEAVKPQDTEIVVSSTFGFPPVGFVWIGDELIGYSELDPQKFKKLVRGIGGRVAEDKSPIPCGPQPPKGHALGAVVIDQRAFAPVLWRTLTADAAARAFDAPEQVRDCVQLAVGVEAAADFAAEQRHKEDPKLDLATLRAEEREAASRAYVEPFLRFGSVHAGVRAGREWQRAVRVLTPVEGGKTCRLELDEARWFAPGTTVRITDGQTTELAIVQRVENGAVHLMEALANDYFVGQAQLQALARRPVNVNTASVDVLELVFTNLAVTGVNDRITRDEARALAEVVVESRPFEGFEDFVLRLVLPAAGLQALPKDAPVVPAVFAQGGKLIDAWDAIALHANALNANDSLLSYSTMPLAFTTRDVFRMSARAVVNAPSGVERVTALREQVELITPQRELMQLWARQEDFDEAQRLDLEAPWWTTGPNATARRDGDFPRVRVWPGAQGTASPPSRLLAHLGVHAQQLFGGGAGGANPAAGATVDPTTLPFGGTVAASREENGWAALWPSRAPDNIGTTVRNVMHFDHETRDPEGRFLPDETIVKSASGQDVNWVDPKAQPALLGAFNFSMWFRPRELSPNQTLFDLGRTSLETDRVHLFFDGVDLVLRVYDGPGDHSATAGFIECGEVRYSVATGNNSPGIPVDTWMHVAIDVRGTRPNQISMLVDGRAFGVRTMGLTRLTGPLADSATTIAVESTEGFGGNGAQVVLRIGNELVEAIVTGQQSFDARWNPTTMFGGRLARVPFDLANAPTDLGSVEGSIFASTRTSHAANTPVELYGFAAALTSNLPSGGGSLRTELGVWTVGRMTGVVGGQSGGGDVISVQAVFGAIPLGQGLEGNSSANAILVDPADAGVTSTQLASAFNRNGGGYAALIQKGENTQIDVTSTPPQTLSSLVTPNGTPLFGVELIRYGAVTETSTGISLQIAQRNALPSIYTPSTARAFVTTWAPGLTNPAGVPIVELLDWQAFVVPISLPDSGGSGVTGFPTPLPGFTEFAQLGGANSVVANTEWVRYDDVRPGHLIRRDPSALLRLRDSLTLAQLSERISAPGQGPGSGGNAGNPGQTGGTAPNSPSSPLQGLAGEGSSSEGASSEGATSASSTASLSAPNSAASSAPQGGTGLAYWQAFWGVAEDDAWPVTRAARTAFQFRGVFGTHTHTHPLATPLLPIWRVPDAGLSTNNNSGVVIPEYANGRSLDSGLPGRFDTVFAVEASTAAAGWPMRVHRAYRPFQHLVQSWQRSPGAPLGASAGATRLVAFEDAEIFLRSPAPVYVAFDTPAPAPIPMGTGSATQSPQNPLFDSRQFARVLKHPSGERPREVDRVFIGSNLRGADVASSVVDEIAFGATTFGAAVGRPEQGGQLILINDVSSGPTQFTVALNTLRLGLGDFVSPVNYLGQLPQRPGLARLGDEIVCYDTFDSSAYSFNIPPGGRGLLGTIEGSHELGQTVTLLDAFAVSTLAANISADDNTLPLLTTDGFPFQGTVLIGGELIHYTRIVGGALEMPRRSSEPGKLDGKAGAIFRGRFGTQPSGHAFGAPVILFPFRYWDRWSERADAPELAYFGLAVDQPSAFFKSAFFVQEEPTAGAARVEVLQRLVRRGRPAPPWDGDPTTTPGLSQLTLGAEREGGHPIGDQADLIEWRAHVRYNAGAFDAVNGASHGWKQTPRLKVFGVEYVAPSAVLRRVGE